ncbi:neurexin-1-beta [Platysternon megacephalum]|uniref:Neurexin-1-beta n=1 Tax=Platysternon megacephalum TaxID=55544 RepID=A0A4D9EG93_9SAUR|nr:neurexin-1-beta [Platysternon megacephalum]
MASHQSQLLNLPFLTFRQVSRPPGFLWLRLPRCVGLARPPRENAAGRSPVSGAAFLISAGHFVMLFSLPPTESLVSPAGAVARAEQGEEACAGSRQDSEERETSVALSTGSHSWEPRDILSSSVSYGSRAVLGGRAALASGAPARLLLGLALPAVRLQPGGVLVPVVHYSRASSPAAQELRSLPQLVARLRPQSKLAAAATAPLDTRITAGERGGFSRLRRLLSSPIDGVRFLVGA